MLHRLTEAIGKTFVGRLMLVALVGIPIDLFVHRLELREPVDVLFVLSRGFIQSAVIAGSLHLLLTRDGQ